MNCPNHKSQKMSQAIFYNIEADYCPTCLGLWFEQDELQIAKDAKSPELNWLDIDLWADKKKFKVSKTIKFCPKCEMPLYAIQYGDSDIEVDICNVCHGAFLERTEFKKVMDYLKERGKVELAEKYWQNLAQEGAEVLVGPEGVREEAKDFWTVLKLLNANFLIKHPVISQLIINLPK